MHPLHLRHEPHLAPGSALSPCLSLWWLRGNAPLLACLAYFPCSSLGTQGSLWNCPLQVQTWEPAGWGGGDCLKPSVSPLCHKVISTLLQLLPLGLEQGFSYCPRWKIGPGLYCSGILPNLTNYFWPWPVWGFEPVRGARTPAWPLWAFEIKTGTPEPKHKFIHSAIQIK